MSQKEAYSLLVIDRKLHDAGRGIEEFAKEQNIVATNQTLIDLHIQKNQSKLAEVWGG